MKAVIENQEIELDPNKKVQEGEIILPLDDEAERSVRNMKELDGKRVDVQTPSQAQRKRYRRWLKSQRNNAVKPTTNKVRAKRKRERQNRKKGRR